MEWKIGGLSVELQPAITKWSFEDLGDNPATHRWRAKWAHCSDSTSTGIELHAYPVIRQTSCGVWIDDLGYRDWTVKDGKNVVDWMPPLGRKFIYNGSCQAWAKPTQDEAIKSLAIRLTRWSGNVARDLLRARSAADALEKLRPDLAEYAKAARAALPEPPK